MKRTLHGGVAGVLAAALAGQAHAAGTTAGTPVSNSATIGYTVGGVAQPNVTSAPASFVVDRRVNLTVAESGGSATAVAPGSTGQVTTFTLTNTTNSALDFRLTATQDASGATTAFADTDNFNLNALSVFVDDGSGIYEPGADTATYVDELAADTSRKVFVVGDIPVGRADGDTAGITLTATAAVGGTSGSLGADMTQTTGADTPGSIDTVFGDGAGDTDAARDGKFSDDDEYDVVSATLNLLKTSKVISDPFNGTSSPKAIPGAVLEYCIQVQNTGSQGADAVTISDPVSTDATFFSGSLFTGGTVTGGVCNADGAAEDDNSAGADESDPAGASFAGGVVSATLPTVAAGTTVATRFRVTIN